MVAMQRHNETSCGVAPLCFETQRSAASASLCGTFAEPVAQAPALHIAWTTERCQETFWRSLTNHHLFPPRQNYFCNPPPAFQVANEAF
jgi:hypothetical protein